MSYKTKDLLIIGLIVLIVVMISSISGCIKSETTAPTIEQPSEKVASSPTPKIEEQEGEKFIDKIDFSSGFPDSFKVSPDNRRIAYATMESGKIVVVDGKKEAKYINLGKDLIFSPNGKHLAYGAYDGNNWFVVMDGIEGKKYGDFIEHSIVFSPDSQKIAYVANEIGKWFVVVDGNEESKYDRIGIPLLFSPDSKRIAYFAAEGVKGFVVVDGKEEKRYEPIGNLTFSPDSKRVAYGAKKGKESQVVVDGKEGKKYDSIVTVNGGKIIFDSPDNLHYIALKDNSVYLVQERIE